MKLDSRYKLALQRLSPVQMEERRRKGLCFNCDEKFQPGHQCKSAKLFLLEGLFPFQESSSNVHIVECDDSEATLLPLDGDNSEDNKSDIEKDVADLLYMLYWVVLYLVPRELRVRLMVTGLLSKLTFVAHKISWILPFYRFYNFH